MKWIQCGSARTMNQISADLEKLVFELRALVAELRAQHVPDGGYIMPQHIAEKLKKDFKTHVGILKGPTVTISQPLLGTVISINTKRFRVSEAVPEPSGELTEATFYAGTKVWTAYTTLPIQSKFWVQAYINGNEIALPPDAKMQD